MCRQLPTVFSPNTDLLGRCKPAESVNSLTARRLLSFGEPVHNILPNTALVSCTLASARPIFFRLTSNKPKHIILSPIPDLLGGSMHAKLVNTMTARCLLPIVWRARADFFADYCSFASSLASARPPLFCSLWPRPICFQCASLALQGFKSNIDLIGAAIASRNLKKTLFPHSSLGAAT